MAILSGRQWQAIAVLAMCGSTSAGSATPEPSGLTASEIKAGFLFNFTKFVEWPRDAFADANAPIVLGIVGTSPFGSLLTEAASGKTVNGRAVIEKKFAVEGDLRTCQILFVSPSENKDMGPILEKLKGTSVLTVGEGDRFTQAGGMIAFVIEGNKVRLLINLEASTEAHLKISAKVIAVARIVVRTKARN